MARNEGVIESVNF